MRIRIIVCVTAALFSFAAYPQSKVIPNGAAGLTFGMTPSEVKKIWKTKGTLEKDYTIIKSVKGLMAFTDLSVGTKVFDLAIAEFVNNKLFEITLEIYPTKMELPQKEYDKLEEIINSKYKEGESFRNFSGGYKDGDGNEMQAVLLGKASIVTYWDYSPLSFITLSMEPELNIVIVELVYQNLRLFDEYKAVLKKANVDEF